MKQISQSLILFIFVPFFTITNAMQPDQPNQAQHDQAGRFTLSYNNILSENYYAKYTGRNVPKISIEERHAKFEEFFETNKSDIMIFTDVPYQPTICSILSSLPKHNRLIHAFLRKVKRSNELQFAYSCARKLPTGTLIMWNQERFLWLKTIKTQSSTLCVFLRDKQTEEVILVVGAFFPKTNLIFDNDFYVGQVKTLKAQIHQAKQAVLPAIECEDCAIVIGLTSHWNFLLSLTPEVTRHDRSEYQKFFQSSHCFPPNHWTDMTYVYYVPYSARISSAKVPDHTEHVNHIIYEKRCFEDQLLEVLPRDYNTLLSLHDENFDINEETFYSNHCFLKATLKLPH